MRNNINLTGTTHIKNGNISLKNKPKLQNNIKYLVSPYKGHWFNKENKTKINIYSIDWLINIRIFIDRDSEYSETESNLVGTETLEEETGTQWNRQNEVFLKIIQIAKEKNKIKLFSQLFNNFGNIKNLIFIDWILTSRS